MARRPILTAHVMNAAGRALRRAERELPADTPRAVVRRHAAKLAATQSVMGRTARSRQIGALAANRHNIIAQEIELPLAAGG